MKRYLFELADFLGEAGVRRSSTWISDKWLAEELSRNPDLDRPVDLPDDFVLRGVTHPLPQYRCSTA